jgi:hypothetical protein
MANRVTFVPAKPEPKTINLPNDAWQTGQPSIVIENALNGLDTTREEATPVTRSVGLVIRLVPFTIAWIALSIAIPWMLDLDEVASLLIFSVLMAYTYYRLDLSERYDSAAGIEHHKIDATERVHLARLEHEANLRRLALETTMKMLERSDNHDKH